MPLKSNLDSGKYAFGERSCDYIEHNAFGVLRRLLKYGMVFYAVFSILISITGYFFGLSIGGTTLASGYVALSLCAIAILAMSAVPFIGIVALAGYTYMMNEVMLLLGISHNFYIDVFIISIVMVIEIFLQVFSSAWTIYAVYNHRAERGMDKLKVEC